jgi:hypothetical protein
MTGKRSLRDAAELITPAVEQMITALSPPDGDAPLVALVRRQARVIDGMGDEVAVTMMPNHTGQLLKALTELELRSRRRGEARGGAPNPVRDMRKSWASGPAGRGRAG